MAFYGAPMGECASHAMRPEAFTGRLSLRRVRLNGDYDSDGTYWGGGPGTLPLYVCEAIDGLEHVRFHLRARTRSAARTWVLTKYPHAKVRR